MIDRRLLDLLCCPSDFKGSPCHGTLKPIALSQRPVKANAAKDQPFEGLLCAKCGLIYPVEQGIPVLLVDQAWREESE